MPCFTPMETDKNNGERHASFGKGLLRRVSAACAVQTVLSARQCKSRSVAFVCLFLVTRRSGAGPASTEMF